MGRHLLGPAPSNPKGHFEDTEFLRLNEQVVGNWQQPHVAPTPEQILTYKRLAEQREGVWGAKDPRWCFTATLLIPHLRRFVIVNVERDPWAQAQSLARRDGLLLSEARRIIENYIAARARVLDWVRQQYPGVAMHNVHYEMLASRTEDEVANLAEFLTEHTGLAIPARKQQAAIKFIDPGLRHY